MTEAVLEVRNLTVGFRKDGRLVDVVRDLSLSIEPGEILALVGESGSGKSVTGLAIMGLVPQPPGSVRARSIRLFDSDGGAAELTSLSAEGMRRLRGSRITMIFQEPMVSLNPTMTIGAQITEVLAAHMGMGRKESREEATDLLHQVGIPDPARRAGSYPHELSGGMRQRAMIAMALSCRPQVLIADEPTTALDVTIQAQILELIAKIRDDYGMAVIFITHDLGVVAEFADRVAVMYCGQIVEQAATIDALDTPGHPYTSGLLRSRMCLDIASDDLGDLMPIPGQPPNPAERPVGCSFRPRCTHAVADICTTPPDLVPVGRSATAVRCHRWQDISESLVVP